MKTPGYKWDGNSRDERESEFSESGFYSTRNGAADSSLALQHGRRRRGTRLNRVVLISLAVVAICAALLYAAAQHLRV